MPMAEHNLPENGPQQARMLLHAVRSIRKPPLFRPAILVAFV